MENYQEAKSVFCDTSSPKHSTNPKQFQVHTFELAQKEQIKPAGLEVMKHMPPVRLLGNQSEGETRTLAE